MNTELRKIAEEQLGAVINAYAQYQHHQEIGQKITLNECSSIQIRCIAAIERASGRTSTYSQCARNLRKHPTYTELGRLIGIAEGLLFDIRQGYLATIEENIHLNTFSDFLDMAVHLLEKNYIDAAAVLAGGALESHLRNLCDKYNVETTLNGKPKKATRLNADLKKANAYEKLEQSNVEAWLTLRNHAAHAERDKYSKEHVELFVTGLRQFIGNHPA